MRRWSHKFVQNSEEAEGRGAGSQGGGSSGIFWIQTHFTQTTGVASSLSSCNPSQLFSFIFLFLTNECPLEYIQALVFQKTVLKQSSHVSRR